MDKIVKGHVTSTRTSTDWSIFKSGLEKTFDRNIGVANKGIIGKQTVSRSIGNRVTRKLLQRTLSVGFRVTTAGKDIMDLCMYRMNGVVKIIKGALSNVLPGLSGKDLSVFMAKTEPYKNTNIEHTRMNWVVYNGDVESFGQIASKMESHEFRDLAMQGAQTDNMTPMLHLAVKRGKDAIIKKIIAGNLLNDADLIQILTCKDRNGNTAIHWMMKKHDRSAMELVKNRFSEQQFIQLLNVINDKGEMPLGVSS